MPRAAPVGSAGWYPGPDGSNHRIWWSGTHWTDYRLPRHVHPTVAGVVVSEPASRDLAGRPIGSSDLRSRVPAHSLLIELERFRGTGEFSLADRRRIRISAGAKPWYLGAVGERKIAELLSQLGGEWLVLHSVPVGRGTSDIDHVVIGQSGVFTINTKHHPDKTVWVGGRGMMIGSQKVPYIRNAAHEARRAEDLLSKASGLTVPVTGVITLVGARQITIRQQPNWDGAPLAVVRDRDLISFLRGRPIFSEAQVNRIAAAAIKPGTWHRSPLPDTDVSRVLAELDESTWTHQSPKASRSSVRDLIGLVGISIAGLILIAAIAAGLR